MSLYTDPETHAKNPPETWEVTKRGPRSWAVVDQTGTVLDTFTTRRDALAHLADPNWFFRRHYAKESRWYAGEHVQGWKTYEPRPQAPREIPATG